MEVFTMNKKMLVAYFSASGVTAKAARKLAEAAIAGTAADMKQYDVVFVGFPIWWYVAPTIINTFLESYDFSGKIIVPFATSEGSGMGRTNEKLAPSCLGAKLLEGKMMNDSLSQTELKEWLESI